MGLYRALLGVYPTRFRSKFADEMAWVFADALQDGLRHGFRHAAAIMLRELVILPLCAARAHIEERRSAMYPNPAEDPGSTSVATSPSCACGAPTPESVRYCSRCGRAHVPLHAVLRDRLRNTVDDGAAWLARPRLRAVAVGLVAAAAGAWAGHLITHRGLYHPASFAVLLAGVAAVAALLGAAAAASSPRRIAILIILATGGLAGLVAGMPPLDNALVGVSPPASPEARALPGIQLFVYQAPDSASAERVLEQRPMPMEGRLRSAVWSAGSRPSVLVTVLTTSGVDGAYAVLATAYALAVVAVSRRALGRRRAAVTI